MPVRRTTDSSLTVSKKRKPRRQRRALSRGERSQVSRMIASRLDKELESKSVDLERQTDNMSNAPSFVLLSNLTQGTTSNQMIGDEVTPTYLGLRLNPRGNVSGTAVQRYRILVFQWVDNNSINPPTITEILQNSLDVYSYYIRGQKSARILADIKGTLAASSSSSDHSSYHELNITKGLKEIHNVGNTETNNTIYVMFFSDQVTNVPTCQWSSRLSYKG